MIARAAVVAISLFGCSTKPSPPPAPSPEPSRPVAADAAAPAPAAGPIPATSRVLITSISRSWDTIETELTLWRRDAPTAPWRTERKWPATLGRTGLAWGDGLHGTGTPSGRQGPVKREGDGKSPAGVFTLGASYGYAAAPPARAALKYTQVDPSWRCVDDPKSGSYNHVLDQDDVKKDWTSDEVMRRDDALYTWVIEVDHNPDARPGRGSCVFLHVWGGPHAATAGCTAMARDSIEALLADLDPAAAPVLVQLPAAEYAALAPSWRLP